MSAIDKLTELFGKFPGIGPRQAKRFVYFLLTRNSAFVSELTHALNELKKEVRTCNRCFRFFPHKGRDGVLCSICVNENRDRELLMLVEKDVDLDNIEKSGAYKGYYFVLGGSIPILEKEPERRIRAKELKKRIKDEAGLSEIILALSNTPDGDNTARYLAELLEPLIPNATISTLGRGLSTGSELEYSDSETIKDAFQNRH